MTRILATGDLHLGHGGGLYDGRLAEQEDVWRRILELARTEQVDLVVFAGDMWERRKPSPGEMLAAERPLVEHHAAAGPPVLVVSGNHDRAGEDDDLALAILAEAGLIRLSTRPEIIETAGISVCTLPWTPVSKLVAQLDGGDRDTLYSDTGRLLVDIARGLREQTVGPAILLLHWSLTRSALPSGLPVDALCEVVLDTDELLGVGFDAIVAGHIHAPQLIHQDPVCLYVGSPASLNHGEPGEHGVWILDVEQHAAEFRPLDSTRFVTVGLPVETWDDGQVHDAIVRVKATFPDDTDVKALTEIAETTAYDCGARHVTVDITVERAARGRAEGLDETATLADSFDAWLTAESIDGHRADRLRAVHRDLEGTLA